MRGFDIAISKDAFIISAAPAAAFLNFPSSFSAHYAFHDKKLDDRDGAGKWRSLFLSSSSNERGTMTESMDTGERAASSAYGGCEGPEAMYVKLISSDGHEFIVKRDHALTSGTIKAMLSGPGQFAENETNEVNFREIPSHVLQKVCMYFTYKVKYTNSSTEIPEFPIPPEIALELLMAANFLDC